MNPGILIGQTDRVGGMEKQSILLTKRLNERNINAALFISSPKGGKRSNAIDLSGLLYRYLYRTRYTGFICSALLRYYCRQMKITHLLAFHVNNARIAVEANLDCRIIYNVRSIKFSARSDLLQDYREIAGKSDMLVTNSHNTKELLIMNKIAGEDRIKVIHNGINIPEMEISNNKKTVLYAGSIKEIKDPITFVRACHYVIKKNNSVKVIMAGEGPMRPAVEKYLGENELENNFMLLGEVEYSRIPYREASVFVNSSLRESNSNSVLEALSFGIPVVATDNPGNRDILSKIEHHKLVTPGKSEEMGEAIYQLLNISSQQRRKIFEESREKIKRDYSVDKMVDEYISLIERL